MVVFTCQNCGESLRKNAVEKHYSFKCRNRRPNLTCVDCLKDFLGDAYIGHLSCLTEDQKYSAKGTVFKEAKGKRKQEQYISVLQNLIQKADLPSEYRKVLVALQDYDNVPRKIKPFLNFMKSSNKVNVSNGLLTEVFQLIERTCREEMSLATVENGTTKNEADKSKEENKSPNKEKEDGQVVLNEKLEECGSAKGTEENVNKLSKKELKKKRKQEKYLEEFKSKKELKKKRKHEKYMQELKDAEFETVKDVSCNKEKNESIEEAKSPNKKEKEQLSVSNDKIEENGNAEEDLDKMSHKELKKKRKHEKYLKELEIVQNETKQDFPMDEDDSNVQKKKSKKSKKNKLEEVPETTEVQLETLNSVPENEAKKSKKRKLEVGENEETEEKKSKLSTDEDQNQANAVQTHFDWSDVIIRVLESKPEMELSLKKLAKKVVNEYLTVKPDHHTYEDLMAKFNKKVKKTNNVRVLKDKAKLIVA